MVVRSRGVASRPQGQEEEKESEIATFVVPDLTIKDLLSVIPYVRFLFTLLTLNPTYHTQRPLLRAVCLEVLVLRVSTSIHPELHSLPNTS